MLDEIHDSLQHYSLLPKITRVKLIFYQFTNYPEGKNKKKNSEEDDALFLTKKKKKKRAQSLFLSNPINSKPSFHCCKILLSRSVSSLSSPPSQSTLRPPRFRVSYREANNSVVKKTRYKNQFRLNEKKKKSQKFKKKKERRKWKRRWMVRTCFCTGGTGYDRREGSTRETREEGDRVRGKKKKNKDTHRLHGTRP